MLLPQKHGDELEKRNKKKQKLSTCSAISRKDHANSW